MSKERTCGSCLHWREIGTDGHGQCYLHPPETSAIYHGVRPIVRHDDVCGQHSTEETPLTLPNVVGALLCGVGAGTLLFFLLKGVLS